MCLEMNRFFEFVLSPAVYVAVIISAASVTLIRPIYERIFRKTVNVPRWVSFLSALLAFMAGFSFIYENMLGNKIHWDPRCWFANTGLSSCPALIVQTPSTVAPATIVGPTADEIFWLSIKDSSAPALFEEFLRRFPKSSHAEDARRRLDELQSATQQPRTPVAPSPTADVPKPASPGVIDRLDSGRRIALGDWLEGVWDTTEFDANANILARINAGGTFRLFKNMSHADIIEENGKKVLFLMADLLAPISTKSSKLDMGPMKDPTF